MFRCANIFCCYGNKLQSTYFCGWHSLQVCRFSKRAQLQKLLDFAKLLPLWKVLVLTVLLWLTQGTLEILSSSLVVLSLFLEACSILCS